MKILLILSLLTIFSISKASEDIVEITENNYESMVVNSKYVWVLDISSKMCESCKIFKPVFSHVASTVKNVKYGIVYIDEPAGLNLANKLNVLDDGLPAVLLYENKGPKFRQIVKNSIIMVDHLQHLVVELTKGFDIIDGIKTKRDPNSDL